MYQTLIADDERKDRSIVKILLERRYAGQFHFWEAENGEQALEILRREPIQLLFLDINMPGLSGVDVLHNLDAKPYVVMLTAYDHFVYAREALRGGAQDYLLKPPLREEFYQAVNRFLENQSQAQETSAAQNRGVFVRELAQQLMYYGDEKKIESLLDVTDIQGRLALCGLIRTEPDGKDVLLSEAETFLGRCSTEYAAAPWGGGAAVFLFCREKEDASGALELFSRLAHHMENRLRTSVETQTGPVAPVPGGYPAIFLRLVDPSASGGKPSVPAVRQKELEKAIRLQNFGGVMETLRPVLEALGGAGDDADLLKYQLLISLNQCGRQFQSRKDYQEGCQLLSGLIGASGQEQVTDIVARYVQWLLRENSGAGRPPNSMVQMVLDKVREDCGQPWSIDSLASSLHVNAYYLSHLFKEHTGQCFTDYLAERRIERAVDLMQTTSLNLAQVGELVGYSDPNYFSRVFKKHKGVGPREFFRDRKTRTNLLK